MPLRKTTGEKIFTVFNYVFLGILAFISLLPILNILAVSFSSKTAASTGQVGIWPVEFTTKAYEFVMGNKIFFKTFFVSVKRVMLGVPINLAVIIPAAYALSVNKKFKFRSAITWFFIVSILFSGGLIPLLMTIQWVGIIDTIWALVLPLAAPVYYIIIIMNFFKALPSELAEAASMDGATHWQILARVYIPISKPAIATILLLCFIMHWNSWFDGLLYINNPSDYPLQSYLQTIIAPSTDLAQMSKNPEQYKLFELVSERTVKSAQIFLATIPIMAIYPFIQKNFTKGLVVGAVKG